MISKAKTPRAPATEPVPCGPAGDPPRISVVIPLFNQAAFVREAVASVLGQNHPNLEIIVIDDGSTDGSVGVLGGFEGAISIHRQENQGPAAARNHGLARATGELIAFLDADDRWPERKLQDQLPPLLNDSRVDVSLGRIRRLAPTDATGANFALAHAACHGVQVGSGLFRRGVFSRVGVFAAHLRYSEDHDWFLRAREKGINIVPVDADGLYYRVHADSLTRGGARDAGFDLPRVIKMSLDRRRGRNGGTAPSLGSFPGVQGGEFSA